jgi:hypothetical protein
MQLIHDEKVTLFYARSPVEFGVINGAENKGKTQ